jgi:hypothetical protein
MKKLGIIQPGRIGDIIICLPIAKWYSDRGYDVLWPIEKDMIKHFEGYVDYVKFIPIEFDCRLAHQVCFSNFCTKVIDLAFTIPNANNMNSHNYLAQDSYAFDEFKYFLADVPFEEKWKLQITRNREKEEQLRNRVGAFGDYVVVQEKASDSQRFVKWENPDVKRIDITPISDSVFDWLGVFENAKQHIFIESCLSNLVDQLNIPVEKNVLLLKHGYYGNLLKDGRVRGLPVLKREWNRL